jgi:hypothetical protein
LIHVLASAKIPVARLPIDLMIANAMSFNRKNERKSQAQISADTLQEAKMASAG